MEQKVTNLSMPRELLFKQHYEALSQKLGTKQMLQIISVILSVIPFKLKAKSVGDMFYWLFDVQDMAVKIQIIDHFLQRIVDNQAHDSKDEVSPATAPEPFCSSMGFLFWGFLQQKGSACYTNSPELQVFEDYVQLLAPGRNEVAGGSGHWML